MNKERPEIAPIVKGRPLFDGKSLTSVLQKLEHVFAIGGTDEEACIYADISPSAFYEYQKSHPEFLERKRLLKAKPILKARETIMKRIGTDPKVAMWYLAKHLPAEFGNQTIESKDLGDPIGERIDFLAEAKKRSARRTDVVLVGEAAERAKKYHSNFT